MIEKLLKIADLAGREILRVYNSEDFHVRIKKDKSPVTEADMLSHLRLVSELKQFEIPILSEEEPIEYQFRQNWKKFWLVDPLDGTKEFISKTDEFAINIALVEDNYPVLGLIYLPAKKVCYYAEKGKGCFLKDGERITPVNASNAANKLSCVESRFHTSELTQTFCKEVGINDFLTCGAALKFCLLAEGEVSIYPRFVGSSEWDTASGQIILEEAGCQLFDLKTFSRMRYNKESIRNNWFVGFNSNININNYRDNFHRILESNSEKTIK